MNEITKSLAKEQIIADEGIRNSVYMCTENFKTCGIGHKITSDDEDLYALSVGDIVNEDRVKELFDQDFNKCIEDCKTLFGKDWESYDPQIQIVATNMCFQMGRYGLSKFKKWKKALDQRDYQQMAKEMQDSRWYKQTTNRAERLIKRIESLL